MNRFDLYERCVQAPHMQARFLRALHAQRPEDLSEDFCGPAAIARAWVALDDAHRAIATDIDPEPLEHAARRAEHDLSASAHARLTLQCQDVIHAGGAADVVAAFNFAICEIHTRAELLRYLRNCVFRLRAGGIAAFDLYAGPDVWTPGESTLEVPTSQGDVIYRWEQRSADPATAMVRNAIHFRTPDDTTLRDAFTYHWRLWGPAELRDAMREAGFRTTEVHDSYGGAIDDTGDPIPEPISDDRAPNHDDEPAGIDEAVVYYIVARV